jgi:hypothetical protein
MAQSEFYVTLPSDASLDLYPDNKANHYITKLKKPLELTGGDWEVALVDVHYPFSWHNMPSKDSFGFVYQTEKPVWEEDKIEEMWRSQKYVIDRSYPLKNLAIREERSMTHELPDPTATRLIKHIKAVVAHGTPHAQDADLRRDVELFTARIDSSYMKRPSDIGEYIAHLLRVGQTMLSKPADVRLESRYDVLTGRVCLEAVRRDGTPLTMLIVTSDTLLMNLLKFHEYNRNVGEAMDFVGYITPLLSKDKPVLDDFEIIYVYSDIASHQPVGNTEAPILGVLPAQGRYPEQSYWACSPAFYVPVAKSYVDTIEIQLNTDDGSPVPFVGTGKVLVRLHFRRRNPFI